MIRLIFCLFLLGCFQVEVKSTPIVIEDPEIQVVLIVNPPKIQIPTPKITTGPIRVYTKNQLGRAECKTARAKCTEEANYWFGRELTSEYDKVLSYRELRIRTYKTDIDKCRNDERNCSEQYPDYCRITAKNKCVYWDSDDDPFVDIKEIDGEELEAYRTNGNSVKD